ncbi:MAG TPA: ATP-binding protein [Isosphaeraceae bacterium]|jgi:AAA+ superfamily predicted ATPase|nr:ATP-binding protein [Isosphaeraceae bacterium]
MFYDQLFTEALSNPSHAIAYHVSRQLADAYPGRAILEGAECVFDVERFARAGLCQLRPDLSNHNQFWTTWNPETGVATGARHAWFEVEWKGHWLDVILMNWDGCWDQHFWVVADSRPIAERFFADVVGFNPEPEEELLVYQSSCWTPSESLFQAIQGATFENLVLPGALKQEIAADLERFFAAQATYERYGVPWKRGILFIGPPGNGKTHAVKALVNAVKRPCIYVKSFASEKYLISTNIRVVYDRARSLAPCVVVLEDLDTLVDEESRSFFLNELDGFATNAGVVTLATTNHPEALDPAIIDRPSRFDRKYHFNLPGPAERLAYVDLWEKTLQRDMRLTDAGRARVVELCEGFSFAYLKELFLASTMAWITSAEAGGMDSVMAAQAQALRLQMSTKPTAAEPKPAAAAAE